MAMAMVMANVMVSATAAAVMMTGVTRKATMIKGHIPEP
jgi:hypothetical protein